MSHWLLVDVSNWAHKLIHAAGPGGGSVQMFERWLEYCSARLRPERVVLAFDSKDSFRKRLNPTYKANRRQSPDGLADLIDAVGRLGIDRGDDLVKHPDFEADDAIATVARIAVQADRNVVIASTDKDLRQLLVGGRVCIARSVSIQKGIEFYNQSDLERQYGLAPCQWVDYQTMVGDSTDNVAGCDHIGDVTARRVLQSCGSLEDHYRDPFRAPINDRQRVALSNFRKSGLLKLARTMVTLRTDVPMPEGWEVAA